MVDTTAPDWTINRIRESDLSIHDWYRFVLSFPPHLVRQYLDNFNAKPGQVVLDPFCGTGTTIVEARKVGLQTIGIEANPMACFASTVKINWDIDVDKFEQHSNKIAMQVRQLFEKQGLETYDELPLFARSQTPPINLRQLTTEQENLILAGSISPRPLHRVLELRDLISAEMTPWTSHQKLALATTIVHDASNLKFGPEVGVRRTQKQDVDIVTKWRQRIRQMVADLSPLHDKPHPHAQVYHGDARDPFPFNTPAVNFVITSPPYPNEKDYTRTTRLESVILGFIHDRKELRAIKEQLLRSNTRNVYVNDDDDRWVTNFHSVQQLAEQIETRRQALGKTSGFEKQYHRVVRLYFGGMYRHLTALKHVLAPGALCAYVVGDQESFFRITIRTGELLAEIAEHCGYKVERIDLWRTRLATATGTQIREEVVIIRWPG